ncbi:Maf-like protein YceF [Tsuneonella dongtanensis]|uniref:Nucleoside triphosphate pyrophosphatase n=1 Tax=Tsuneonella dongtanensis TaxID=692370 RepID=A0A1B2AA36_9SPHN|nr:Maf family protein [Tsuneonella dongtanensis]ANY19020.1 Maf-like protein YceF [Tsuneonella dongtanensis]
MIVLASKSASRAEMLAAAGVAFEARPAAIDERALEASMAEARPDQVALALAEAKALAVDEPERPVLGSDSLVVVGDQRFDKPASREDAARHLRAFSGRPMQLHSAAAIARGGAVVWRHTAIATLQVRTLSEDFIEGYLDAEWPAVSHCVGVFRIEARGVQLFDRIEGDHFTVLGMPLLPVLGALRDLGELPA